MSLDPHCARVLKLLGAAEGQGARPSPDTRRRGLDDLAAVAAGNPPPVELVEDLAIPGVGSDLRVRRYDPDPGRTRPGPAMVYLHGGGWVAGGLETHDGVCRRLALAGGFTVLALDYRLAPEHPFPCALEDALAALRWTVEHAADLGIDPQRLVLAGDSAGATLAAALAISPASDVPSISRLLLLCPILDLAQERPSRIAYGDGFFISREAFAADLADYLPPGADRADPRVSPLRAENLSRLPPTHIHLAECDPFHDEGEAFAEGLAEAGVVVELTRHPGMIHYFYALPRLIPHARAALDAAGAELRAALA